MASVSDFRNGMVMRYNNDLWMLVEFQHVKPGKGHAFVRTKLKNVKSGKVVDVTFRESDVIEEVRLEERPMTFLYADDGNYHFMDDETYEQTFVPSQLVGDLAKFLREGDKVKVLVHEGRPIQVQLPNFVELKVVEAEPAVKGDTATALTKQVTLETGAKIQVPAFIKEGDVLKIDTRTSSYVERVGRA